MLQIIADLEEARRSVLRRLPFEEVTVSPQVSKRIKDIFGEVLTPPEVVARIISDVRQEGDKAVFRYNKLIDGLTNRELLVQPEEFEKARRRVSKDLVAALQVAAERIRKFHQGLASTPKRTSKTLGRLRRPLSRVGIYVPGGGAAYPSSLLMNAIPAQVAGVKEIVIATPPTGGKKVASVLLAAAELLGLKTIYKMGGAHAIAAMAYGTDRIRRVDKIVGPGNLFVVLAKKQVYGTVGIDGLAGPSEIMIVADERANPDFIAADLLSQAEHDPLAVSILITPSAPLAKKVQGSLRKQVRRLARSETIEMALRGRGAAIIVNSLEEAFDVVNEFAPEHLEILVENPEKWLDKVTNAGAIFLGPYSPVPLGDYVAGPSHVLPTGGEARYSSALSVEDFVKYPSLISFDQREFLALASPCITLAEAEGLEAHGWAVRVRMPKSSQQ